MKKLQQTFKDIAQYPSALIGLAIIAALICVAIYTIATIPYAEAMRLWRGGEDIWYTNPKIAAPAWTNTFSSVKLPVSFTQSSQAGTAAKRVQDLSGLQDIEIVFTFDYDYDDFPQDVMIYFQAKYAERAPHVDVAWVTPDGREIRIGEIAPRPTDVYRFTQDERLIRRLKGALPQQALFADPAADGQPVPLKGVYTLRLNGLAFEEGSDIDAEFVLHGKLHGLAGTDHRRRDLMLALLWGTPIALAFGLLAALGTTLTTMILAAIGVWFGGVIDGLIQRVTEVNMILPALPILVMVGTFYSSSIWLMLGVIILLNIFGAAIKTYRAIFMQVKESPYIEAARAYGASNMRIIFRYMIPRIIPMLVPQL